MNKKDDFYLLGYHVVCLIDVLGQKDKLTKWAKLPTDGKLTSDIVAALKQTAGAVLGFRDHFLEYFNLAGQCTMIDQLVALPPEQQALYWRFKECKISVERFSDTFVFYSLISNTHGDASVIPLHQTLGACCMAIILSLAARLPVRGGITIGSGLELEDRNFYGPALSRVHYLESEIAGYPRIVVSNEIRNFLAKSQVYSDNSFISSRMQQTAESCQSLLCRDSDGQYIVDFIGKGVLNLLGPKDKTVQAVRKAYEFVQAEAKRFRTIKNTKLAERYDLLQQYMESRLPIWGIKPSA